MVCEFWTEQLDTYFDGEAPSEEIQSLDAHVRNCPACSRDALTRVQMKRAIQGAGKRYTPNAEFRTRMQQRLAPKRQRSFRLGWTLAAAAAVILMAGTLTSDYLGSRRDQVFSEIADLHVATLASSSPVDVISTDRHTVKPWFQGRIPFAFNLPELTNTEFSLLGGRMTYVEQTPGAHLIYNVRKHRISVFVFREQALRAGLIDSASQPGKVSFNTETWSQGGLRYFVIGDASAADIDTLSKLFKGAS